MGYFSSCKVRIWRPKSVSILRSAKTIALQGCDVTNRAEDKSVMADKSSSRRDANGTWLITPGVKNPKHVFVFLQQTRKQNSYTQNPYIFDTFDIDGDNSARLDTCRLQYGTNFYPELDYDHVFKIRILNDLINFRYRKNDYNTGVQLQLANFEKLYPIIYFDLRNTKESVTGDPKKLEFHYRLNEAANAQDYMIFAVVMNEQEFVLKQIGNELVAV